MAADTISVIKLHDVLMVTVPPDPDDETVSALQERVLQAMERYEAKGLVLDISTVETLDSFFARTVVETVQMVALMGGRTVVGGDAAQRRHHGHATGFDVRECFDGVGRGPRPGCPRWHASSREAMAMTNERTGEVRIDSESDIVTARKIVRDAAMAMGFGVTDVTRIVTAASELTRNVFRYAGSGVMRWRMLSAERVWSASN